MLQNNKKGVNNKCHIHREEALTEEGHTEARITAAIRTEAQEEAHATQEAPTFREQEDLYIMISYAAFLSAIYFIHIFYVCRGLSSPS